MNIVDQMEEPEVRALRKRYHELYGTWCGYHWNNFGGIEDYVAHLKKKIAEKEKELGL